jgi:hypothetical protein
MVLTTKHHKLTIQSWPSSYLPPHYYQSLLLLNLSANPSHRNNQPCHRHSIMHPIHTHTGRTTLNHSSQGLPSTPPPMLPIEETQCLISFEFLCIQLSLNRKYCHSSVSVSSVSSLVPLFSWCTHRSPPYHNPLSCHPNHFSKCAYLSGGPSSGGNIQGHVVVQRHIYGTFEVAQAPLPGLDQEHFGKTRALAYGSDYRQLHPLLMLFEQFFRAWKPWWRP